MLVLPPVTLPVACVMVPVLVMMPSLAPTKPPAALEVPTVTLPVAKELRIVALLSVPALTHSEHLLGMLLATSPPAVPLLPVSTLPVAKERSILPLLSPTRPPALSHATLAAPTLPVANESLIVP